MNLYTRLTVSIRGADAFFPYYGLTFETAPGIAPTKGFCWAYAYVWWPGEV